MAHTNLSSYLAVKNRLLEIFRTEEFPNHKLPPEDQLAKRLGISLVTLREALMMLALEGYLTKRHGVGNFIHPSALDPKDRVDQGFSFADAFQRNGRRPGMQMLFLGVEAADAVLAERLRIREGDLLQRNETLYTADGEPGVFTVSRLPAALVKRPFRLEENNWYVHECIWDHCGRKLAHSLNDYRAVGADEKVAELFRLHQGTPLLYCEQLFYDVQDQPVLLNIHYFHPEHYGMRILQNWDVGTA
ncbi:GntR family transcriptional regulator [Pseudoflavonifractor sp. MSJ-37]|uniref:GntR family transcriptional regulator n=1 Tax=Pseudoflavonifractor sp. MSJ-37 TaxID=2841531 RepID=UPI001C123CDE|nr:GntR family transcriptional regulator [Pseudoflavonifractor sp. MSJ-37]